MPSLKTPKTVTERSKVILHLTSGKQAIYKPKVIEDFLNKIQECLEKGFVIKAVEGDKITFFNANCIERVEVIGAAVITKVFARLASKNIASN